MAEKRIDINAKKVNGEVSSKEYKTSVSIKEIAAKINTASSQAQVNDSFKDIKNTIDIKELKSDVIKNKQYQTGKFDTKLKVTVTGLGEESIPNDANFKRLFDQFSQSDFFLKSLLKSFIETQQSIDSFNRVVSFNRVINENQFSSEFTTKFISKILLTNFTNTDTISKASTKVLSSTFSRQDIAAYTLGKIFAHTATNTEISRYTVGKSLTEEQNSVDLFNRIVNFQRFFEEFCDSTDDYCQICPDDDQTATFTKVVKDLTEYSERISKNYAKPVLEVLTTTTTDPLFIIGVNKNDSKQVIDNGHTSNIGKRLNNQFGFSDFSFRSFLKTLEHNAINSEIISKNVSTVKLEESNAEQLLTLLTSKVLNSKSNNDDILSTQWDAFKSLFSNSETSEAAIFSLSTIYANISLPEESIVNNPFKVLNSETINEDILISENGFFRLFTDRVDATDDFNEVELDDDQNAIFTKVIKDNNDISELLTFDTSTVYEDLSVSSEGISNLNFKVLSSESSQEEFIVNDVDKVLLDSFNNIDINFFDVNSIQSSQYTTTDVLSRVFNSFRSFENEPITNTVISNLVNSVQNSQTANTDDFSRIVNYNIELESLSLTIDKLIFNLSYNLNTITDPQDQLSFNLAYNILTQYSGIESISNGPQKNLSSNLITLDQFNANKFISRKFEDEHQALDSGLINNQNYFAEAYVEPGYVGINRTI